MTTDTGHERTVTRMSPMPVSAAALYDWHLRPGAFERLAPPWEPVRVVAQQGGVTNGGRVTLEVHAGPLPLTWTAEHRDVEPGRGFTDFQVEGPFRSWVHRHAMIPDGDRQSFMGDTIRYAAPLGPLGALAGDWYVDGRLEKLLRYRHALLYDDLLAHQRAGLAPMQIAISGASGMIGRALAAFLTTGGHQVTRLVRHAPGEGEVQWDPARGTLDASALEGMDAVVHLSGENVGDGRWSDDRKRAILESRTLGTGLLARALAGLTRKPTVLVSVSAIGIYGSRGEEVLTEQSTPGNDFLASVCKAWEAAAEPAEAAGIRVVHPRFGVVLSPAGGALAKMLPAFRLGAGGPMGEGKQWMSWLSVDDAVGILHHAIATPSLRGVFNAVTPHPVTNGRFAETLGSVLHRPSLLPVPAFALRLLFGEMADGTILASQRCAPTVLGRSGYAFRHPTLDVALAHLLGEG
jgi:uncharacterized protein (TIGR01777 family)